MDLQALVGTSAIRIHRVRPSDTASSFGSGGIEVLATPVVVGLMEGVARDLVQPHLGDGETTVGGLIAIRHLAPTPVDHEVRIMATVVGTEGRRISFRVEAHDEAGLVAEGTHERWVVHAATFAERVAARFQGGAS